LVVDLEFGVIQVQVSEDFVLLKDVVADDHTAGMGGQIQGAQLLKALHEEVELGRESRAGLVAIEGFQKGIVLHVADAQSMELLGEEVGKSGLADPNGAFNRDEVRGLESLGFGHRLPRAGGSNVSPWRG